MMWVTRDVFIEKIVFILAVGLILFVGLLGQRVSTEERVKGYKVKVQHQPVREEEKKTKREAVAQVIVQALRRLKKGEK